MRCPNCKKIIETVNVYSQCYQKACIDDKGNVSDYGSVEEILETMAIECPECAEDLTKLCTET
jgi:hypothetical protein